MKFEITDMDEIKPSGKYKYIATVYVHPSQWTPWKKAVKKQAVSEGDTYRKWFWTDTFKQTSIDDPLNRFLMKQDYENQIMKKLAT